MGEIGAVVYRLGNEPRTLSAQWVYSTSDPNGVGSGTAFRSDEGGTGFTGRWEIAYRGADGTDAGRYLLEIDQDDAVYALRWLRDGVVVFEGAGFVVDGALIGGWRPCASPANGTVR